MGRPREGRPPRGTWGGRDICLCAALVWLAACTGSSSQFTESEGLVLTGSVGDGPIVSADIRIEDADGALVMSSVSDSSASYQLQVPDGTRLPVLVRVSGGTDLVTGRAADFELIGASFESGPAVLNASPYTTLAVKMAQCMGELNPANLTAAWDLIDGTLNLGWDRALIHNLMDEPVAESNVGTVLLSNEALGEVIRRTSAALSATANPMNNDEVMAFLACDLLDGRLDGRGDRLDPRAGFTALAAATVVRLEVIAGMLDVDGQPAAPLLDNALQTVLPGSAQSVATVIPGEALIAQAQDSLGVLQLLDAPVLLAMAMALEDATPATARDQLAPVVTTADRNALASLPEAVALADDGLIADLALRQENPAWTPLISFAADATTVTSGATTRLSWATTDAERCYAAGGWTGEQDLAGSLETAPLTAPTEFTLSCSGRGGVASDRVFVNVTATVTDPTPSPDPIPVPDPEPAPEPTPDPDPLPLTVNSEAPTLSFSASEAAVDQGDPVTLSWSSTGATSCTAGGAWSGSRSVSGSQQTGPIDAASTFSLTCSGPGGNVMEMLTVRAIGAVPLSWVAPTENVDGSALTDLAGYRIYYGSGSRAYGSMVDVPSPASTSNTLQLSSGDYYVAMTALDDQGNESAYSNEVVKTVP